MEYRYLGKTGLRVSEICLGTMQFKWTTDEPTSYAVLDAFYEAGGNFLDTADIYSNWAEGLSGGESETVIGNWLARRGGAYVAARAVIPGARRSLRSAYSSPCVSASVRPSGSRSISVPRRHRCGSSRWRSRAAT